MLGREVDGVLLGRVALARFGRNARGVVLGRVLECVLACVLAFVTCVCLLMCACFWRVGVGARVTTRCY